MEDHLEAQSAHSLTLAAEQRSDVLVLQGWLVHQKCWVCGFGISEA